MVHEPLWKGSVEQIFQFWEGDIRNRWVKGRIKFKIKYLKIVVDFMVYWKNN